MKEKDANLFFPQQPVGDPQTAVLPAPSPGSDMICLQTLHPFLQSPGAEPQPSTIFICAVEHLVYAHV